MREAIIKSFKECHLTLNMEKTKVVGCYNFVRHKSSLQNSFDYLGCTFRPRIALNTRTRKKFTVFTPTISKKSRMKIHDTIRSWKPLSKLMMSFEQIEGYVNLAIIGWIIYYSRINKKEFRKIPQDFNECLARWMQRKYKSLRRHFGTAIRAFGMTAKKQPNLFVHWTCGYRPYLECVSFIY